MLGCRDRLLVSMLKSPLDSWELLLNDLREKLGPDRKPLLIAIDGADGVGKSSLASWLAWQLGMPTVHVDLFLVRGSSGPYRWRIDEIEHVIASRIDHRRPIIVEGIFILDVLEQISRRPDFMVFIRGEGSSLFAKTGLRDYFERRKPEEAAQVCLDGFAE